MSAAILRADGHLFPCVLRDYSDGGVGVEARESGILQVGDNVSLLLKRGQQEYAFPFSVTRAFDNKIGLRMTNLTIRQHIDFIQCTFARADTWALWQDSFPQDKPVESLVDVLALGFRGYLRLADYAPPVIRNIILAFLNTVVWVVSFIPRYVGKRPVTDLPGAALPEKKPYIRARRRLPMKRDLHKRTCLQQRQWLDCHSQAVINGLSPNNEKDP